MSKNLHTTLSFLFVTYFFASTKAARFNITNNCPFVVWAAAVPGGGRQLNPGQTWPFDVSPATTKTSSHIWARTGCRFDPSGRGRCESGDCDGVLECQSYGRAPYTLAEYILSQDRSDFFSITLVLGFNVPMEFSPTSPQCRRGAVCAADINGPCPMELRDPGGCNHPCTVFSNDQFCCTSAGICEPTSYSKFFKDLCPNVYTYVYDEQGCLLP